MVARAVNELKVGQAAEEPQRLSEIIPQVLARWDIKIADEHAAVPSALFLFDGVAAAVIDGARYVVR